jgi:Gram-negative bacterial TonB protein C-terminal
MRSGLRAMGALRPDEQPSEGPVALETAVVATGARPGRSGDKRELFTEETQTVLVFEKGAVIRLSAAVADGQLLFLTNKKNGKEVVTQVVRKRSFRPTSCYVDLEFTEASPGFWSIEFPKTAPEMPSQGPAVSGEEVTDEATTHTAPPDLQEVERLKKEVSELQTQLKTLIGSAPGSRAASDAQLVTETETPKSPDLAKEQEEKLLAQLLAQEAEQERPHGPKRLVAYSQKSTSSAVKIAGKIATVGAFAVVVVAAGVAAYRFGLIDAWIGKSTPGKSAPSHASATPTPNISVAPKSSSVAAPSPNSTLSASQVVSDSKGLAPAENKPGGEAAPPANAAAADNSTRAGVGVSMRTAGIVPKEPKRNSEAASKRFVEASSIPSAPLSNPSGTVMESNSTVGSEDYVGPKLVRAVKPVPPPEALRSYITGNVKVDALVDVTGHVRSVTVVSGPKKLWNTAIEQVKQYIYEPARKNGKPVTSHVQTSLQYWYEP